MSNYLDRMKFLAGIKPAEKATIAGTVKKQSLAESVMAIPQIRWQEETNIRGCRSRRHCYVESGICSW